MATKTEVRFRRRAAAPVLLAPLLAALGGCTKQELLTAQEELREELQMLQARLARIESDTAMQSRKIRELSVLQDRRASEVEPVPAVDLAVGRPVGSADSTGDASPTEASPDGRDPQKSGRRGPDGTGADEETGKDEQDPAREHEVPADRFTERVQKALRNAGCDPGPVDGRAGAMTKKAIREFQRDNNLPETGVANEATWDLLKRYE